MVIKASRRGDVVVSFHRPAARSFRRLAGRSITVSCTKLPKPKLGIEFTVTSSESVPVPRRRRPFRAGTSSDRRKVKAYPTTSELVHESKGQVCGLASPDATPPEGYTGYWSAGGTRAVVAALSATGRRLYIDVDATDERFSSNVSQYLNG